MKRHVARHFASLHIKGLKNILNHTDVTKARPQIDQFRRKFAAEKPKLSLAVYSEAPRTGYCVLFATLGIADGVPMVKIPHLYPEKCKERRIMEAAIKEHKYDLRKYSAEQIAALDRIGKLAAEAIQKAEVAAGLGENAETLVFGHAPSLNAIVAALAGTSLAEFGGQLLMSDLQEGDRFVVEGTKISFVPLGKVN